MVDLRYQFPSLLLECNSRFTHLPASNLVPSHRPAQPIKCYTMNALKHSPNIFSGPYLPSEEIPQGVCGSATSCISDLRPHCLVDPASQEYVSLPSAVSLQCFPAPRLLHAPCSQVPNQPTLRVLSLPKHHFSGTALRFLSLFFCAGNLNLVSPTLHPSSLHLCPCP